MRKLNYPLFIGGIIVTFLIFVALCPGFFTDRDPLYEEVPKYVEYKVEGKIVKKWVVNPMAPNKENIMGTDDAGRDVYARLVYGTRNTLKLTLFIAIFRMILALPLGLAGGMGSKLISNIIKVFNTFFTAIPMLLFSFLILNIGYFKNQAMNKSIFSFAIVLTIVGWGKLAGMIEDSTRIIMEEDFIEGEIAIGKTKLQIAYQNVVPHLIPTSISLFFKEMGMALFLIAQLAVLYVFVGATRPTKLLAFIANYSMAIDPEWGNTLSRIAINARNFESTYWMTLYPVLVFSIAIIGINLVGEGLRIEFQKRESRVISSIKKISYLVSPRMFISQLKDIRKCYKPVIIKFSIIIVIIAYMIIPWNPSLYKFDIDKAKLHVEELTKDKYGGRVTGTEGGYLAGEYIISTLKSYGYEVDTLDIPLKMTLEDGTEANYPEVLSPMVIDSGWIKLIDKNGEEKTYQLHKDFTIASVSKSVFEGNEKEELYYKGVAADKENITNVPEGKDCFYIEKDYMGPFASLGFYGSNSTESKSKEDIDIQFIIDEDFNSNTNAYFYKFTSIVPFDDLKSELESGYKEVEINLDYPKLPKYKGRNITAFLPGKDKTYEEPGELIEIGASYDGVYNSEIESPYAMTATPTATALEVARQLSLMEKPLEKSIQFVFWDNECDGLTSSDTNGSYNYSVTKSIPVNLVYQQDGYYYFDIAYPGYREDKKLDFITFPNEMINKNTYLMGTEIEKRLKHNDVKYERRYDDYGISLPIYYLKLNALSTVGIGNSFIGGVNRSFDRIDNINYERMEDIGQIIVDTMTMNSHIMD